MTKLVLKFNTLTSLAVANMLGFPIIAQARTSNEQVGGATRKHKYKRGSHKRHDS